LLLQRLLDYLPLDCLLQPLHLQANTTKVRATEKAAAKEKQQLKSPNAKAKLKRQVAKAKIKRLVKKQAVAAKMVRKHLALVKKRKSKSLVVWGGVATPTAFLYEKK